MNEAVDSLWVVVASALVMSMQVGFCMLEAGLVRSKNTINVAMKNFMDFVVAALCFWAFGFALMFGLSHGGWIGGNEFLYGSWPSPHGATFFLFQLMFCATAATIVSGAVAERLSFKGYLAITFIISGLLYPLAGHWAWNSDGWLARLGFVDFAGSSVVHSVGGWVALAAVSILGPRLGRFSSGHSLASAHSLGTSTFGTLILFVGWLGFNGGSGLVFDDRVPDILVNTVLGGVGGAIVSMGLAWRVLRLPDLPATLNGGIAGLVAVTANCHAVSPAESLLIGAVGGLVCFSFERLLARRHIDDVVGAVAAHGAAGAWGTIAVAVFGDPEILGTGLSFGGQLSVQTLGVLVIFAWAGGGGWLLLKTVNHLHPLRVSPEMERVGLNVSEHGASTEMVDLLSEMGRHREEGEFTRRLSMDAFTEVGQIAAEYNRVIDKVAEEMELREGIAARLRVEHDAAEGLNRKLLGSIEYARRIQDAILPRSELLTDIVGEHGLLYRPRDLVSGDFYWCLRVKSHVFVAVVDCTGHGVPGALMSLVGHAVLQQVVAERQLLEPAEILAEMHVQVRDALRQDSAGNNNQDGMDVCLVRIDEKEVIFAGARRPLWWLLPDQIGPEASGEIKGSRASIGGGQHEKRKRTFEQHVLPRRPGLRLFLGSDGFADQPNHLRQPFDLPRLRDSLRATAGLDVAAQVGALAAALDAHCGGAAQRDDITLIGIQL